MPRKPKPKLPPGRRVVYGLARKIADKALILQARAAIVAQDKVANSRSLKRVRQAAAELAELLADIQEDRCLVCGCTSWDCSSCARRTGHPCHWIDETKTLCSACVGRE